MSDDDGLESFSVGRDDFDPAAWMGDNWYCGCGCEFVCRDAGMEAECPDCGRILARNGGYVDDRTREERKKAEEG
jgi:hypothetical protein